MREDFELVLRAELESGEEVLWQNTPNVENLRITLLTCTILWLAGLFMIGAGILKSGNYLADQVLSGLILLLILVAIGGIFELIFVPGRAARTLLVRTNKRIFSACVSRRWGSSAENDRYEYPIKEIVRESTNTIPFFYMTNLPSLILFFILGLDAITALRDHFDPLIAVGYLLVMIGWLLPQFFDMRLPLPKFRDAPRTLYTYGSVLVFLESFELWEIDEVQVNAAGFNSVNAFIVSEKKGCIRMRSVPNTVSFDGLGPPEKNLLK